MNFAEEISIVTDALTYVEAYGPDGFPAEDCTDLTKEAHRIIGRFDVIAPLARGSTRQHWLALARQEIVAGFDSFPTDAHRGRRHIADGIEFIRRAIRGAAPQAAFVVGPDGITHHACDVDPKTRNG
jgi:hypothetical protein